MYEIIQDPITVIVRFGNGKVLPMIFKWKDHVYKIESLHLTHKKRDGEDIIYYFNVSDETNYFKLSFSTKTLGWRIEELYWDG